MRSEVLGIERRRRWRDEEKLSIVDSLGTNGASVTDIAFCREITRSQIYGWRRELKRKGLLATNAPVRFLSLPSMPLPPDDLPEPGVTDEVVEIVLRGGRSLRVGPGTGVRVYFACGVTDMRKGIGGLSVLIPDALPEPGRRRRLRLPRPAGDRLKPIYWDSQGFCLYYKVLERSRFPWPTAESAAARLTSGRLAMLWEGIDWRRPDWGAPPARAG